MPPEAWRTLVLNRASGPSSAGAATAVATLVVDAGVASVAPLSEYSTLPVRATATSTPSCGPTSVSGSMAVTRADSPAAVGTAGAAAVPAGASTVPARTTGRVAATGMCNAASL